MNVRSVAFYMGLLSIVVVILSVPIYGVVAPAGPEVPESCTVTLDWYYGYELEVEEHDSLLPQVRMGPMVNAYRFLEPDDCIRALAEEIHTRTGYEGEKLVEFFLLFVHYSIQYADDMTAHGMHEWWQYPCETLALGTGDCEDKAVLFVSLCRAMGFECILVNEPGHVSAGVLLDCPGKNTITYDGKEYVTADPTKEVALGVRSPEVEIIWPDHWNGDLARFILLDVLVILAISAWFTRWALT